MPSGVIERIDDAQRVFTGEVSFIVNNYKHEDYPTLRQEGNNCEMSEMEDGC